MAMARYDMQPCPECPVRKEPILLFLHGYRAGNMEWCHVTPYCIIVWEYWQLQQHLPVRTFGANCMRLISIPWCISAFHSWMKKKRMLSIKQRACKTGCKSSKKQMCWTNVDFFHLGNLVSLTTARFFGVEILYCFALCHSCSDGLLSIIHGFTLLLLTECRCLFPPFWNVHRNNQTILDIIDFST